MSTMIPAWVSGELKPVEKLKVHQLGLRHKAVSVFVLCGPNLLLQRRAENKYHTPGLWSNTCCTHPAWTETSLDCANRRLREELGITGLSPKFTTTLEYRADVGNGLIEHELVDMFCAQTTSDVSIAPDPGEVSDTRWVHLDDLQAELGRDSAVFTPWMRIYMKSYASRILGSALTAEIAL